MNKPRIYDRLVDWGHPIIDSPSSCLSNIETLIAFLLHEYANKVVYLIGTGKSGAMILAMYQMRKEQLQHTNLKAYSELRTLCYIAEDQYSYQKNSVDGNHPVIIVDDDILSGHTLDFISSHMGVKDRVEVVYGLIKGALRGEEYQLVEKFPNIKHIIH